MTSMKQRAMFVVGVVVIGLIGFLVISVSSSAGLKTESHAARVDWLPLAASDITYARRAGFGWSLTYECSLREEEFRSLAETEARSEEHTSELQSPCNLVCRLLLEK